MKTILILIQIVLISIGGYMTYLIIRLLNLSIKALQKYLSQD